MDIAYDNSWGYHALLISLANTCEVLRIVNRSGNRPSHEGAAEALDRVMATCFRGGFRSVLLRGDTDFSQTTHLDQQFPAKTFRCSLKLVQRGFLEKHGKNQGQLRIN